MCCRIIGIVSPECPLADVGAWAKSSLTPRTTVVSDGLACFSAVTEAGCEHQKEVVGKKRKSTDMACFTWVNTVLGNLKTAITGTYHAFDFDQVRVPLPWRTSVPPIQPSL